MKAKKIVLIMTDTQRQDMLSCYGNEAMRTHKLDEFASESIRFDKGYTCQPVCGPARSALFTGQYPHTNGVTANSIALSQITKTVGERMQDGGFHTAYVGKWHLDGGDYFGEGECPEGWDPNYWYDMRNYLEELSDEDRVRSRKYATIFEEGFKKEFTYANRCSNRAIDFLQKHNDEDFFLVVSYDEPHDPSLCPPEFDAYFQDYEVPKSANVFDDLSDKPEHHRVWAGANVDVDKEKLKIDRRQLLACNAFVDTEIGRVMDAVKEYAEDALVIYTSDHGTGFHNHNINIKGACMYEEITKIPFMIKWPGVTDANVICNHPVSHIDLVPTILDAAGLPIPKMIEGNSLVPTLKNTETRVNDSVFMEFTRYEVDHDGFGGFQPIRCAFDGKFKLVVNLMTTDELYDLENDPFEMKNLILDEAYAEIRNKLHDDILNWMNKTRDPFRGYYWERRPWRDDAREASWEYTLMTRQRDNDPWEKRQLDYCTGLEMEEAVRTKAKAKL